MNAGASLPQYGDVQLTGTIYPPGLTGKFKFIYTRCGEGKEFDCLDPLIDKYEYFRHSLAWRENGP